MNTDSNTNALFIVLGNQLFPTRHLASYRDAQFFMAESFDLCTYFRHHKQKIVLFLAAMRAYADGLIKWGARLDYLRLDDDSLTMTYEEKIERAIDRHRPDRLVMFEIEDHFFANRMTELAERLKLPLIILPSPMFLTSREGFLGYLQSVKKPFMATFYQRQRKRLNILVDDAGKPLGGQWSFDADNRKKLPAKASIPQRPVVRPNPRVAEVCQLVDHHFPDHPGRTVDFWLPVTRRQALAWFDDFLAQRFDQFGDYEDALSTRDPVLFHSAISSLLNLGLVTPDELIDRALEHATNSNTPLNSLEGFVRQVIGWREFIRGIYHQFDHEQQVSNFWGHQRKLTEHWYNATTDLLPLDNAIAKALRYGWAHHIERLMVLGNLMLLCEIQPQQAHRWFMEMFVDASDWVMGPNVYGMALFSDGGLFATKPYLCGSNYLLKMSDYRKGPWCDVLDGLYWRFVAKHRKFFQSNPRLAVMPRSLDKLDVERRKRISAAADTFLDRVTC